MRRLLAGSPRLLLLCCVLAGPPLPADEPHGTESWLLQRIQQNPDHSDSWRLLGRFYYRQGNAGLATKAYRKSLELDPGNAAAHFDSGQLLQSQGDDAAAAQHFRKVFEIASESSYADRLRQQGHPGPADITRAAPSESARYELSDAGELLLAGYEIQTFDSSLDFERRVRDAELDFQIPNRRFRFFLESGALYNTNVTLTPVSRQLVSADAAGAQLFVNPELEWVALDTGNWRAGPLMRGFFAVNERHLREFNLASFQPGAFLERDLLRNGTTHVGRLDYVYSLDLLNGRRFGDRHAITVSLTSIRPDLDATYAYVTTSFSQFNAAVTEPAVNSLDGPAVSLGLSRFFRTSLSALPLWSLGADLEYAHTEGADFRYFGGRIHADMTVRLSGRLDFVPGGNVGFRAYPDFTGTPDRTELIYRLTSRLRYRVTEVCAISLVVNYDRFASKNAAFDAERLETGIVTTILY